MKTVYVSGPMTGIENYNFPEFYRVAALLEDKGYNVLNPAEHGCSEELSWSDYLKKDISDMLQADIVATLDGWEKSKGAKLEVYIAQELGMEVVHYRELL
jgi:predicted alpha/beta hydrolase